MEMPILGVQPGVQRRAARIGGADVTRESERRRRDGAEPKVRISDDVREGFGGLWPDRENDGSGGRI